MIAVLLAQAARRRFDSGVHDIWEWMEANATFVYPAIAIGIIALVLGALLASWRSDELDAEQRGALKDAMLKLMRRRISGVSAESVGAELQIDTVLASTLLAELVEQGLAAPSGTAPVHYRIRGRS
jgi:hypothetical protein